MIIQIFRNNFVNKFREFYALNGNVLLVIESFHLS